MSETTAEPGPIEATYMEGTITLAKAREWDVEMRVDKETIARLTRERDALREGLSAIAAAPCRCRRREREAQMPRSGAEKPGGASVASFQSERQFSDAIVELATLLGWEVMRFPTWRATAANPGYPDLTMAHANHHQIIFAELKRDTGRLTGEQHRWLDTLDEAAYESVDRHNVSAVVWRPRNWPTIEAVLKGERCARCAYQGAMSKAQEMLAEAEAGDGGKDAL